MKAETKKYIEENRRSILSAVMSIAAKHPLSENGKVSKDGLRLAWKFLYSKTKEFQGEDPDEVRVYANSLLAKEAREARIAKKNAIVTSQPVLSQKDTAAGIEALKREMSEFMLSMTKKLEAAEAERDAAILASKVVQPKLKKYIRVVKNQGAFVLYRTDQTRGVNQKSLVYLSGVTRDKAEKYALSLDEYIDELVMKSTVK